MFSWLCQMKGHDESKTEVPGSVVDVMSEMPIRKGWKGARTAKDAEMCAETALQELKAGNARFVTGSPDKQVTDNSFRTALSSDGQSPVATIIGCADSRCPVEIIFDALPGDIFVLRNAGNTCTHSEGSMVGSMEYSVQHLRTKLVLVLGHTKCGAIAGATKTMLARKAGESQPCSTVLDVLLSDLVPVAAQAEAELKGDVPFDDLAAYAVRVNVFHTMERLLEYSATLREKVSTGEVMLQGAIYNLDTGVVEFVGASPRQALLVSSHAGYVPRPDRIPEVVKAASDASTAAST